jgi:hypothetical protein
MTRATIALLLTMISPGILASRGPATADTLAPAFLTVCGSTIQVEFHSGKLDLSREPVLAWVQAAADSVATYYGRFPVPRMTVRVVPVAGDRGVLSGRTWGGPDVGSRMDLGEHTTQSDLNEDWTMTHELVHTAFPDLDERHHWIEEGIAVYVEPIARVQHGSLKQDWVWADMVRDMPKGEPEPGARGLDQTHSWASTYWGGALFFLNVDVAIREQTHNRFGLQDALRAILADKNIQSDGTPEESFAVGDRAVGVPVLENLYAKMSNQPVTINLDALWKKLGVHVTSSGTVRYDDRAPDAAIRKAIFAPRPSCGK